MLTEFGKKALLVVVLIAGIGPLIHSYLPLTDEKPVEEPAPVVDYEMTSIQINRIFRNYKWKPDDMSWNVERISTIINSYPNEFRKYDRPMIVGGKNLIEPETEVCGAAIEINGNVIESHKDEDSSIMPSISGVMESYGETVLFTVRTEDSELKKNITIVGTLVGYDENGVPYVMGVIR